ncbi:hypothetical protein [Psychrobacter aestuarii]
MFTHSTSMPDHTATTRRKKRLLYTAMLSGVLSLSACQQQTEPAPTPESDTSAEDTAAKPMTPSESAAARIEAFQPRYVMQKQALQRRLQAEYESLQAADATGTPSPTSNQEASDTAPNATADNTSAADASSTEAPAADAQTDSTSAQAIAQTADTNAAVSSDSDAETIDAEDINTSVEAGERDLAVLQKVTLEPRAPEQLAETDIIEQYQDAMKALYAPADTPLTAAQMNTLLNIASLVPSLFEHTEIADRLVLKSPALARLVVQHQVWQQIEAQQAIDMQNMKKAQQAEFETLMEKFNSTIKDYDEQIEKYEQTLKSYQQE